MHPGRNPSRVRARSALLASGLATAGLAVLAGCGSGGSNPAAGTATLTPVTSSSAASSPATSNPQPSWASALGTGVTVTAPQSVAPGHGSPGAAAAGEIAALDAKNFSAACEYLDPTAVTQCKSETSQVSASDAPYAENAAIGYVAIDGDKALVGTTGKYCSPGQSPECFTNTDPAAIFSSGKSFSQQWSAANASSPPNVYSLAPCIKIDGKWYIDSSSS
jgi:hypothetical protein